MTHAKLFGLLLAVSGGLVPLPGQATTTLDQLLTQVRRDRTEQAQQNADRERRFLAQRDTQRMRLTEAQKHYRRVQSLRSAADEERRKVRGARAASGCRAAGAC